MKKALVTGVNGFVGPYLVEELVANNYSVIGIGIEDTPSKEIEEKLEKYLKVNLIEEWPDIEFVDVVIHLAGLSSVGPSYENPQMYINGNTGMLINMAEYYLNQKDKPRIIVISSGAIYDNNQTMPITEKSRLGYTSPYSVSKIAVENLTFYYRGRGLELIIARPFNHIGPRQGKGFLIPDICDRIAELGDNRKDILVGNLNTKRDYTDVRDVVHAYVLLASSNKLKHSIYNICSGTSISGIEILDYIKKELSREDIKTKIDQSLVRPTDILEIIGDNSNLKQDTGWKTRYNISDSIHDFLLDQGEIS